MTMKQLASQIAKIEGKKVEVSVGNVREILGILSDMLFEDNTLVSLLLTNGKRRAKNNARPGPSQAGASQQSQAV
jgi:hypothetical protein